jgi:uncharacterized repeat protein (TIGR01451 family)
LLNANTDRAYAGQSVTLIVKLTNNSATTASNIFVDVEIPSPYDPYNNQTGTYDGASRTVSFWVEEVPAGGVERYVIVVRVASWYAERSDVTFTADITYDQNGYTSIPDSAQDVVDTGSLGDGELQLSTNTPGPPDWLTVRMSLGQPGNVTLKVYNSAGELVRILMDKYPGSEREVLYRTWDGKNMHGETVSAGVYVLHAIMPHTSRIAKVVVLH